MTCGGASSHAVVGRRHVALPLVQGTRDQVVAASEPADE